MLLSPLTKEEKSKPIEAYKAPPASIDACDEAGDQLMADAHPDEVLSAPDVLPATLALPAVVDLLVATEPPATTTLTAVVDLLVATEPTSISPLAATSLPVTSFVDTI